MSIRGTNNRTARVAPSQRMFEAAGSKQKHLCELVGEDHYPVEPNPDRPASACTASARS
jgi:hypothetical protein